MENKLFKKISQSELDPCSIKSFNVEKFKIDFYKRKYPTCLDN